MKVLSSFFVIVLVSTISIFSQNVAINTTGVVANTSSMLDVSATNKGILVPRVALTSTTDVATITTPANSLFIYNTATAGAGTTAVTPGFYYWDNAASVWRRFMQANEGWLTGGNLGTTAGTNFAGTIDNISFDIRTNNVIRGRFMNTGEMVVNNTANQAGDVFSVYGTGSAGAITAAGLFAVNGYVGANGFGVYGESNSGAGSNAGLGTVGSLQGATTPTGTYSAGVYGENTTTPAGTGTAIGVVGFSFSTTGAGVGVYGSTASVTGNGVFGISTAAALTNNTSAGVFGRTTGTVTTGNSIGVRGYSDAVTGNGYGLYGQSLSNTGIGGIGFVTSSNAGLQGQNAGTGDGVRGYNTNATPGTAGAGMYGQTNATTSGGGEFTNTNASGTGLIIAGNNVVPTYLTGGSGVATSGTTAGTFSFATTAVGGIGVIGVGNNQIGSIFAPARGCGVAGTGTQYGVMGFATTVVNTDPLTNSAAAGANGSAGGYFEVQNGGTAQTWTYVGVRDNTATLRKIIGPGTVNTIVKDLDGKLVALSCPEAPENLFQDYGHGKLVNGFAHVDIDPILAKNIIVNDKHPLRVFVQLEGDCQGVYVLNKTGNGFDVKELNGGNSNVEFSYTIVANRADEVLPDGSISKYSDERFPNAPGPQDKINLQTEEKKGDKTTILNELPVDNNTQLQSTKLDVKKK